MASKRMILSSLAMVAALAAAAFVQTGHIAGEAGRRSAFAMANGTRFTLGGRPFYSNGFNAYWLMYMASDPADRSKATAALEEAARLGATLVRTWAFADGGYRALQVSPAVYNEDVFRVCRSRIIRPAVRAKSFRDFGSGPFMLGLGYYTSHSNQVFRLIQDD